GERGRGAERREGRVGGHGTGTVLQEAGARRLHLVGIGGSGMASLAAYLLGRGDDVSGCDQKDGALLRLLRARGARIEIGHDAAHVHGGADCLIHTAAAGLDHPELAGAAARSIPIRKYAQFLGLETRRRRCVAVAGTHGKTTTTTLVADLLIAGGRDPSAVVGGFPLAWELPGRAGKGEEFVVEACEYDRSCTNFEPHVALVTNVEPDHLDYFGTHENVVRAFEDFLRNVRGDGFAVLHESAARQLDLSRVGGRVRVVGTSAEADARIVALEPGERGRRGRLAGAGPPPLHPAPGLPGAHTAVTRARAAPGAPAPGAAPAAIEATIRSARGVRRRLEALGTRGGVHFLSDYAHHPTEIRAVRLSLRASHPSQRL